MDTNHRLYVKVKCMVYNDYKNHMLHIFALIFYDFNVGGLCLNLTNLFYELLKADNGYQVTTEQLKLAEDQNLDYYLMAKGFEFPITPEERSNRLMKGQIDFEILKFEAVAIAEKFDSSGIDYRFLKGLGIAVTYPNPYTRIMGDFDILVKPETFEDAALALRDIGYHQEYSDPLSKDISFIKVGSPHIELHRALFELSNYDFYKDYEDILDLIWSGETYITVNNLEIKVPSPQEHFKFIILHFFRHFTQSGCGARFLLDIHYFTQAHQIDFSDIEGYFSKGQLKKFVILMNNMLSYYFDSDLLGRGQLNDFEIKEVQIAGDFLLFDGVFGKSGEDSEQTNRLIRYKRANEKSTFKMLQAAIFPSSVMLDYRFGYAKKLPLLLPVAWIHRFVGFVFGKRPAEQKLFFLSKNNEVVEKKETALKQLGYY